MNCQAASVPGKNTRQCLKLLAFVLKNAKASVKNGFEVRH